MNHMRGIGLKVLSTAFFMAMAVCIKASADAIPPGEAVFFRSFFAIPVIVVWLVMQHDLGHGLATKNRLGHLWRGLVGTSAMALGFTALGLLPLPEVTAIGYARPLLTVILAAMFLGETVRMFRLGAVLVGLVGVIVVLSPRLSLSSLDAATKLQTIGAMAALMGAVFAAMSQVFVRKLVQTETTASIVFYFSVTASLLSLLTLPSGWVVPNAGEASLLVLAGLFGGVGQILLTNSYRFAPTSVIAPFDYVSMLMALVIGYTLFSEVPTRTMLAGSVLVVLSGLFIIWRERQLGLKRGEARRVMTPHG